MDKYKELAEELWSHFSTDMTAPILRHDPDYADRWIETAAEKMREIEMTIDHFFYLVDTFKVASYSNELNLLLQKRGIVNAPDVIRLVRELQKAIVETSERDQMAFADAEFPPRDAPSLLAGYSIGGKASKDRDPVSLGKRVHEEIEKNIVESAKRVDSDSDAALLGLHERLGGKPLVDTAYPPKPLIKVIRPPASPKPPRALKDFRLTGISLIDHCPLCGSKDNERAGIHPHTGKICLHPQSLTRRGDPRHEKMIEAFTICEPCDCSVSADPHYHIDEHMIAPWDVFTVALEKWKAEPREKTNQ